MNPTTARPNRSRSAKSKPRRHNRFLCHEIRFRGVEDQPRRDRLYYNRAKLRALIFFGRHGRSEGMETLVF